MTIRHRLAPEERREVILVAAVRVAMATMARGEDGEFGWTRNQVADACQIPTSPDTVKFYWRQPELRAAVRERLTQQDAESPVAD